MLAVESNVSVINLSMVGYDTEANAIVKEAIKEAIANGITVIGAAGNYNMSAKKFIPGSIDDVITVGAANEDGTKYSKSNTDADVYVVATSTSEATAIYTGLYTAGNLSDERIYTSLVTVTEETSEETTEETSEDVTENNTSEETSEDADKNEGNNEGEEITFNSSLYNYIREFQQLYGGEGYYWDYEINADGTVTFIYRSTDFETAMDSSATACIEDCGEVSASLITVTSTGATVQTGTCTLTAGSSSGYGTVSGFSGSGMFTDILSSAGVSSLSVCCDRHWDDETSSQGASGLSSGTVYYKEVLESYTNANGEMEVTIDILISEDGDFSERDWSLTSRSISWSIYSTNVGSLYYIYYTINGTTTLYGTYPTAAFGYSDTANIANAIAGYVYDEVENVLYDMDGYSGKKGLYTSGTFPTSSTVTLPSNTGSSGTARYNWYTTSQSQVYRGRIKAAPSSVKATTLVLFLFF